MALNPVDHEAAVRGTEGYGAGGVDVGEVGFDVFEAFDQIDVWTATPILFDAVLECHAVACAAGWVGSYDNVTLLCVDEGVPAGGPGFSPGSLRLGLISM